jgi:hypothetical protein
MFSFLKYIVEFIFNLRKSRKVLLIQITILQKEVEILKRSNGQNRLRIKKADIVILAILNSISHIKEKLTIVKPETVLRWQKELIKSFWTFKRKKRPGRPSLSREIRKNSQNSHIGWSMSSLPKECSMMDVIYPPYDLFFIS